MKSYKEHLNSTSFVLHSEEAIIQRNQFTEHQQSFP